MRLGIELPNQENIRKFGEKKTYNYLRILKADSIKQEEMKEKIINEYLRRTTGNQTIKQKSHQTDKRLG